MSFIKLKVMT